MKYVYYYQTSGNENRSGEIKARDRADAYTKLRKQGIRPYRVVGDDPVRWRPVAYWTALAAAVTAAAAAFFFAEPAERADAPLVRQQLAGDAAYIACEANAGWTNSLSSALDRRLAAYAQPGWDASRRNAPGADSAALAEELATPPETSPGERPELRQLKRIVIGMRAEAKEALAAGGTLADYFAALEDRQRDEIEFRARAVARFLDTPPSLRPRMFVTLNLRLRSRNLAPIPESMLDDDQRSLVHNDLAAEPRN